MLLCFCKKKNECNICFQIKNTKKCTDCDFKMCKECYIIWAIENQKKICPHCQKNNTYKFNIKKNKVYPKYNLEKNETINTETNNKENVICYCTIYCFNQVYHIFIICLVILFLAISYFFISFSTCSTDSSKLCLYCFLLSILLFFILNGKIIYNMNNSFKSELLVLISLAESFLIITIFSKKNDYCSLESFEVYVINLLLFPILSYTNIKLFKNH